MKIKTNQPKPTLYTYDPAAYAHYSAFKTKKAFNTSFEMWLADYKRVFGRKELQALKTLVRFSVKVYGIATLSYKTLVREAKNTYGFKFCPRTAKRAVEKARDLGMLKTLETRKKRKDGKYGNGPLIYIWQPYEAQNVTLEKEADQPAASEPKPHQIKAEAQQAESPSQSDSAREMSPHKTSTTKAINIKLLNTCKGGSTAFTTIDTVLRIKQVDKTIKLFTKPVKPEKEIEPLRFHSRLKYVVYSSHLNTEKTLKAISEMVYGKVYSYTRFPVWADHKETMLEHALRVVEVCLEAHKKGKLNKIKSMRGFINHALNAEIDAYVMNHIEKLMPEPSEKALNEIMEFYA